MFKMRKRQNLFNFIVLENSTRHFYLFMNAMVGGVECKNFSNIRGLKIRIKFISSHPRKFLFLYLTLRKENSRETTIG